MQRLRQRHDESRERGLKPGLQHRDPRYQINGHIGCRPDDAEPVQKGKADKQEWRRSEGFAVEQADNGDSAHVIETGKQDKDRHQPFIDPLHEWFVDDPGPRTNMNR